MRTYEQMEEVLDIMWGNIEEAKKYMGMAYEWKDTCRAFADWCKAMATGHMAFNDAGKPVYDKMKETLKNEPEHAAHLTGIMAIMDRQTAKIAKHAAKANAMIAAYK